MATVGCHKPTSCFVLASGSDNPGGSMTDRLLIVGGGFAGVWAAMRAAAVREQSAAGLGRLAITVVSQDPWLTIRPRLYESTLDDVRVPLDDVLGPLGVERVEGRVTRIDAGKRSVELADQQAFRDLQYDRLILAAGSHMSRARLPGGEHAFSVDTYDEAVALRRHLDALPAAAAASPAEAPAIFTVVVIGAGFTGIEVATTISATIRALAVTADAAGQARVLLVERADVVVPDLSESARQHVLRALDQLGIDVRLATRVQDVHPNGVAFMDGEFVPAATVISAAGFRASQLAAHVSAEVDETGRVPVDVHLRVRGAEGIYAAGDVARAAAGPSLMQIVPMSCQCAIPMGEIAGRNAAADLLGLPPVPYGHPDYVTCLDLGPAGALFMEGWQREVRLSCAWAKVIKESINRRLIYPPWRSSPRPAGKTSRAA
jgi:NADH dehydrogenase